MNDNKISHDTLPELRAAMDTLKRTMPHDGIISQSAIRRAMRSRSIWLNYLVIGELIMLPIIVLALFGIAHFEGMSIWPAVVFVILAVPDTILDLRTMAISQKWISEETLVGLSHRLIRQKKERHRQTAISTALMVLWLIWFFYELVRPAAAYLTAVDLMWLWAATSALGLVASLIVIAIIYRKAQKTNDEMIASLSAFEEDSRT